MNESAPALSTHPHGASAISDAQRLFLQEGAAGFADMVETWRVERIIAALGELEAVGAVEVLDRLPEATLIAVTEEMDARLLWRITNTRLYPSGSVGRTMASARVAMRPEHLVEDAVAQVRSLESSGPIINIWIARQGGVLVGSIAMSHLLVADPKAELGSIMNHHPPALPASMQLATLEVASLGFLHPVYAVLDDSQRLVGVVRSGALVSGLFEGLSARPGRVLGVDSEERISTPARIGLRTRLPWLTINLFTCFVPALVVVAYSEEVRQHALLAAFIPILIGQSINAGGQSLAIMMRTIALGEVEKDRLLRSLSKEVRMGVASGGATGLLAALAMWLAASATGDDRALPLAWTVMLAMLGACVVGSSVGTAVPWLARRWGFDPSMVSHIVLTTITDLVSITLLLGIGSLLLSHGAVPLPS